MATIEAKIRAQLIDEASGRAQKIASSLKSIEQAAGTAGANGSAAAREHATALDRLTSATRASTSIATAAEAQIQSSTQAHHQAAAAAEQLATASARAGAATEQASGGLLKVDAAAKQKGRALAENVNLVSEMALGFGALSPATQQAAIAFAGAGNNAFALANALGPIGPVIALATGLIPAAISAWMRYGDAAKSAATRAREAREAFLSQVDAARQLRESEERERALRRGDLSVAEQGDALETARKAELAAIKRRDALTTGQLGEDSMIARAAGLVGGRGLRLAVGQASGADVVDAVELASRVAPIRTGTARDLQTAALGDARDTTEGREQAETAFRIASEREARETLRQQRQSQVDAAGAASQLFEADLRRMLGPEASGQRRADRILSSVGDARRDESGRVVLSSEGSAALRGLPESERAAVTGRIAELLQAQRRADEAQRAILREVSAPATAANLLERVESPTARPDVGLRASTGDLGAMLTRYIEAQSAAPSGFTDEDRAIMRDFTRALAPIARDGLRVGVDVRSGEGAPSSSPILGLSGIGSGGR